MNAPQTTIKAIIVECGRENSIEAETFGVIDERSQSNARWTTQTAIDIEPGDTINMEYAIIHQVGSDSQTTMEITGEPDENTNLVDNKSLMVFTPYICNNGYNLNIQPYYAQGAGENWLMDKTTQAEAINGFTGAKCYNQNSDGYDYGAPQDYGWTGGDPQYGFDTDSGQNVKPFSPFASRWLHLSESCDSKKYVKLRTDYEGPFRAQKTYYAYPLDSEIRNFKSFYTQGLPKSDPNNEWEFLEERYEIPIEITAPNYETPDTICNYINTQFHRTEPQTEPTDRTLQSFDFQRTGNENIFQLNGPLFRTYNANGENAPNVSSSVNQHDNPFWGQIAVKDLGQWYGVHYFMRMPHALQYGNTGGGQMKYPCYWWGQTVSNYIEQGSDQYPNFLDGPVEMCPHKFSIVNSVAITNQVAAVSIHNAGTGYNVGDILTLEEVGGQTINCKVKVLTIGGAPSGGVASVEILFQGEGYTTGNKNTTGGTGSGCVINVSNVSSGGRTYYWRYYATLPVNHIVPTNIDYTEENIKWIAKVFDKTEKYGGSYEVEPDIDNDFNNWYVDLDIGRCADANNGLNDQPDPSGPIHDINSWTPPYNTALQLVNTDHNWDMHGSALCPNWLDDMISTAKAAGEYFRFNYKQNFKQGNVCPPGTDIVGPARKVSNSDRTEPNDGGWANSVWQNPAVDRNVFRVKRYFEENYQNNILFQNYPKDGSANNYPRVIGDARLEQVRIAGTSFAYDDSLSRKYNVGVVPIECTTLHGGGTTQLCCGFVIQTKTAERVSENLITGWEIGSGKPTQAPLNQAYCGFSPSSMDNPYGTLLNRQMTNYLDKGAATGGDLPDGPGDMKYWINGVNLGANNLTLQFNSALSRCEFTNLHIQRQLGANEVIYSDADNSIVVGNDIGTQITKFNDLSQPYGKFNSWYLIQPTPSSAPKWKWVDVNDGVQDAHTGLFLMDIYLQSDTTLITASTDTNAVLATKENFYNTLLYKLGFRFNDLFVKFGLQSNRHNPGYEKDMTLRGIYKSVKPLTTNSDTGISAALDCSLQDSTASSDAAGQGQPDYTLGYCGFQQFNVAAPTSTAITASNLPTRLDSSFYQVYTDFCNPDYKQARLDLACVGIIARNYATGDFLYGFNTTYTIPITAPRHISKITTEIRSPNGNLAPINAKSTVLYKVSKSYTQPTAEAILNPEPDEEEEMLKLMKKNNEIEEGENDRLDDLIKGEDPVASGVDVPFTFSQTAAFETFGDTHLPTEAVGLQQLVIDGMVKKFIMVVAQQYPIDMRQIQAGRGVRQAGKYYFDSPDIIRYLSDAIVSAIPKINREVRKYEDDILKAKTSSARRALLKELTQTMGAPYITGAGKTLIGRNEMRDGPHFDTWASVPERERQSYLGRQTDFYLELSQVLTETLYSVIQSGARGEFENRGDLLRSINQVLIGGVHDGEVSFFMKPQGEEPVNITAELATESPSFMNAFSGDDPQEVQGLIKQIQSRQVRGAKPYKGVDWIGGDITPSQRTILQRALRGDRGEAAREAAIQSLSRYSRESERIEEVKAEIERNMNRIDATRDAPRGRELFDLEKRINQLHKILKDLYRSRSEEMSIVARQITNPAAAAAPPHLRRMGEEMTEEQARLIVSHRRRERERQERAAVGGGGSDVRERRERRQRQEREETPQTTTTESQFVSTPTES